ncbi:Tn3 family transposase [Streptomyces olivaceoviridis]
MHIDALFGEVGRNVIDWDLIESQFKHLRKVAVSVREGAISSLRRLRSGARKNATYAAFREVGRVIRTVQLLRYLSDPALRRRVTAATNKTEVQRLLAVDRLRQPRRHRGQRPRRAREGDEVQRPAHQRGDQDPAAAGFGQAA